MSGRATLLECVGLEAGYGNQQVLFGVDFTIDRGEVVALVGTNGAGKSTLLRAISQLVTPSSGRVIFDGRDITRAGPLAATGLGIVHMPGGRAIFPSLTVAEHFKACGYLATAINRRDPIHKRVDTVDGLLDLFPILRSAWNRRAGALSGGEQQQLALATVMLAEPKLLLIDELSLGLAPTVVDTMIDRLIAINATGCSIVVVDQSIAVAARVAQDACFMERGQVRFRGAIDQLLGRRDVVRSVFLPPPRRRRGTRSRRPPAVVRAQPAVEARSLSKSFDGIAAVERVSFTVADGAIVGLIGPNGAGKTTVIDLISGLLRPDAGSIMLAGRDITRLSAHRRARLGLGRSFQDARVFPGLTASEAVAVAFESRLDVRDHLASTLSLPAARAMEHRLTDQVDRLLDLLHLDPYRDVQVARLSTGTRRVVELAMAMAHRPRVLLLDEPSAGLAHPEVEALAPLLLDLRQATQCSMLVVEHDMALIDAIADEVVVIDNGRVRDSTTVPVGSRRR